MVLSTSRCTSRSIDCVATQPRECESSVGSQGGEIGLRIGEANAIRDATRCDECGDFIRDVPDVHIHACRDSTVLHPKRDEPGAVALAAKDHVVPLGRET